MKETRYRTIDGLRGIAAMSVVIYHLTGNLETSLSLWVPQSLLTIASLGYLGVPVFFVISGFVISASISNNNITLRYFGNFVLRRSIRLDPPYWISIVIAFLLLYSKNYYLNSNDPIPTSASVISHIFYLQELLGFNSQISQVYWTLCLEIQFYLFYIISLAICQIIARKYQLGEYIYIHILCVFLTGLYSLSLDHELFVLEIEGLFFQNWHYFLMGIFLSLQSRGIRFATQIILIWLAIEIILLGLNGIKAYALTGLLTSIFIFIAVEKKLLNTIFTGYIIQYLGRISYSLYLLHADLGWKVISFGKVYFGEDMKPILSILVLCSGIVISIAAAHILNKLVEKPSLLLASKLRLLKSQ
jgi:peptidoglycan/LPS O-acetylase OafA/YrhL